MEKKVDNIGGAIALGIEKIGTEQEVDNYNLIAIEGVSPEIAASNGVVSDDIEEKCIAYFFIK